MRPNLAHECPIKIRLSADKERVRGHVAQESNRRSIYSQFFSVVSTRRDTYKQVQFPLVPLLSRRLLDKLKPRITFRQHYIFDPPRPYPRWVTDLEVKAALGEGLGEGEFPVEKALLYGD